MINKVFDGEKELKAKEGKFLVGLLDGSIYEADSYREMVAVICGTEYLDAECAETELHMRVNNAKQLGLSVMAAEDIDLDMEDDDIDEDEELCEPIIVYDERIGKIPYSYTDANVDYDIHGTPELIRVECNKTFIYSLELARLIAVFEKDEATGEYKRFLKTKDLAKEIDVELEPFRKITERVPLHKKLGE